MTLGTIHRSAATFIMAVFALRVQHVHPFRCIFPFRIMTFTARGRGVAFVLKVVMAISTFNAIAIFGKMCLMIKKHVAARIFEHNPDGIFRGFFCECRVANHADQQKSRCQAVGDGSKSLVIHDDFP